MKRNPGPVFYVKGSMRHEKTLKLVEINCNLGRVFTYNIVHKQTKLS